jgi:hypothetical protein
LNASRIVTLMAARNNERLAEMTLEKPLWEWMLGHKQKYPSRGYRAMALDLYRATGGAVSVSHNFLWSYWRRCGEPTNRGPHPAASSMIATMRNDG